MYRDRLTHAFPGHSPLLLWSVYARYRLGAAEPPPLELLRIRWMAARYTARRVALRSGTAHLRAGALPYTARQRLDSIATNVEQQDLSVLMRINPDGVRVYDWDFPQHILSMSLDEAEHASDNDEDGTVWYRSALRSILRRPSD